MTGVAAFGNLAGRQTAESMPGPHAPTFQSPATVCQTCLTHLEVEARASSEVVHKGQPPGAQSRVEDRGEANSESPAQLDSKKVLECRGVLLFGRRDAQLEGLRVSLVDPQFLFARQLTTYLSL